MKNILIALLLALAGAHCTLSIFYDNEEWINLPQYAAGAEHNPFQERVAMVPLLRWADKSPGVIRWSHWLQQRNQHLHFQVATGPDDLISLIAAIVCVWAALFACCLYGHRMIPGLWWLPAALVIAILYASYAARYEHALCYPYDLPHMFLFGVACACLLNNKPWWALLFFTLDVPMRETSIYLLLLSFCLPARRTHTARFIGGLCLAVAIYAAIRIPIIHAYRHNTTEVSNRVMRNLHALTYPIDWPTLASSIGFLLIPVWLGRRYLNPASRLFLWLTLPCLAVSAYFGIAIESRIFVEWTIPFALLATAEIAGLLRERTDNSDWVLAPGGDPSNGKVVIDA